MELLSAHIVCVCIYVYGSHGRNTNTEHITLHYIIQESRVTRQ
jgi:hypothetical protein